MYRVVIGNKARKQLKKIPKRYQSRIGQAVDYLATDPLSGKKLRGEGEGKYSLRVWPYRIIYSVQKRRVTVFVLAIGHRQGVYD